MVEIESGMVAKLFPERPEDGHKGTFGTALICAGSEFMTGAAVLSVDAALRSGVGMVRLMSQKEVLPIVQNNRPCALTTSFEDTPTATVRKLSKLMPKISACGIGPGIDKADPRAAAVLEYLIENAPALVIDASALDIVKSHNLLPKIAKRVQSGLSPAILTPHVGEYKRLTGGAEIDCCQFALENKCVTVLKNNKTIIAALDSTCYINKVSNSALAKGGSGDVLTGLITGFAAQGLDPLSAAVAGVHIHSLCGIKLAEQKGVRAGLPSDLTQMLPEAFKEAGLF